MTREEELVEEAVVLGRKLNDLSKAATQAQQVWEGDKWEFYDSPTFLSISRVRDRYRARLVEINEELGEIE